MVRWCWMNFLCRGILLIWIRVRQGPTALAVGAGEGCLDIFFSRLSFRFSFYLWETAQYGLKYCLKGPLSPKQPTNHHGWMTYDITSLSTVFHLYLDQMKIIMKGCVQWNPIMDENTSTSIRNQTQLAL